MSLPFAGRANDSSASYIAQAAEQDRSHSSAECQTGALKPAGNKIESADDELSTLRAYFNRLSRGCLLSPAQEIDLARAIQKGDKAALNLLVQSNLRLVVSIARRYMGHGVELEDLIQEGNLGLIQAAHKFDPQKGTRFSTYATWWVRQAVQRAIANKSRPVRIPVHINQQIWRLKKAARPFFQNLGRPPSLKEWSKASGVPPDQIMQIFQLDLQVVSLDEELSDDSEDTLEKLIEDRNSRLPEDFVEEQILKLKVDKLLARLSSDERRVMELRYGIGSDVLPTDAEIALAMDKDALFVRRAAVRAMRKLRKYLKHQVMMDYVS